MRRIKLIAAENQYGLVLAPVNVVKSSWFANFSGGSLPHDLLAHGLNETGSLWQEIAAQGRECWLSSFFYRHKDYESKHPDYVEFAISLESVIINTILEIRFEGIAEQSSKIRKYHKFDEFEDLKTFFDLAYARMMSRMDAHAQNLDLEEEKEIEELEAWLTANKEKFFDWVCFGFWHASCVKFKDSFADAVWETREELRRAFSALEKRKLCEGQEILVTYDARQCHVELWEKDGYRWEKMYLDMD